MGATRIVVTGFYPTTDSSPMSTCQRLCALRTALVLVIPLVAFSPGISATAPINCPIRTCYNPRPLARFLHVPETLTSGVEVHGGPPSLPLKSHLTYQSKEIEIVLHFETSESQVPKTMSL